MQNFGHAGFEDVFGLFGLLGGEGDDVAALGSDVDRVFVEMEAVDEGRRAELDLVLFEELLQVDFPHAFAALHVPMDELGVVARGEAQVLLLRFNELDGIDDVEMALI